MTENLFAMNIEERLTFLKQEISVDLHDILEDESMTDDQRFRAIKYDIAQGLLTSWKRGDPEKGLYLPFDFDVDAYLQADKSANGCETTEMVMLSTAAIGNFANAEGDAIRTLLFQVDSVCNLVIKHKEEFDDDVVNEMVTYGVDAFTSLCGTAVGTALSQSLALTSAIAAGAVAGGVTLIALAVAGLVTAFIAISNTNRTCLGIIINNTSKDVTVSNWRAGVDGDDSGHLYMSHGKMVEFMQDSLANVQIKAKPVAGGAYAGLYLMSKKSGAWVGCEGTMRLTIGQDKVDFLSCCPLSQDNRVNLAINSTKSITDSHDALYCDKRKSATVSNDRITVTAKINALSGSPSYAVAIINEKTVD